ncbi:MAG: hypothetical protein AAGA57_07480 [Planctomycetota bacterium]
MRLAVDPHCHVHARHDVGAALSAAERAAGALGGRLVCCLAEMPGQDFFARWRDAAEVEGRAVRVVDAGGLVALGSPEQGAVVYFAPGRQVATTERLEMLALATEGSLDAGLSLAESAQAAREAGGLACTPWGVGKWSGARGEAVVKALREDGQLVAGDNGGRPVGWRSGALEEARKLGRTVLPGSDPLPMPAGAKRLGSLGVWLDLPDPESDEFGAGALAGGWLARLRGALAGAGPTPETFGRHVGWAGLVVDQFKLRLSKGGAS